VQTNYSILRTFLFNTEQNAQEFALELLQYSKESSLSLCLSECGRTVSVSIGFVKADVNAANLLAGKVNDTYQQTNNDGRSYWSKWS
jgi:hypothetical protein